MKYYDDVLKRCVKECPNKVYTVINDDNVCEAAASCTLNKNKKYIDVYNYQCVDCTNDYIYGKYCAYTCIS